MEENINNDDMSIFGNNAEDFELNFQDGPEGLREFLEGNEGPEGEEETPSDDDNNNIPNEDADPNNGEGSEKVVGQDDDEGGDDNEVTSPNLYSSFASTLIEKGLLPSLDLEKNKIESVDDLTKLMEESTENRVKDYIVNKVGEEGYNALEKGVTLAEYQQHSENITNLESIDKDYLTDNVEMAKRIILQDYMNQGLDEAKSRRILEKIIDDGEESIIEEAVESTNSLKQFEANRMEQLQQQRQQEAENLRKEQEKIDNDLKNAIYNSKEIIKGIEVNKNIQDKVYNSITKIVGEGPNGIMENKLMRERRENPVEFDTKLYYLYEITDGFKDFSKLTAKAKSNAAQDFERVLRQTKFDGGGGNPSYAQDSNSYDGVGDEIVL